MTRQTSPFSLSTCARPNILALRAYRCAREYFSQQILCNVHFDDFRGSDYKDDGTNILLDANENAYGPGLDLNHLAKKRNEVTAEPELSIDFLGLNRYPDPHQEELKKLLCERRNIYEHTQKTLRPENLVVGVGSDEIIDALLRCFCIPGHDKMINCPPTYGMYAVSAQVNDVKIVNVPLDPERAFSLRPEAISNALSSDPAIKLVYICSPGNPTGSIISKSDMQQVLEHPTWNGVVVLDEAYTDFAPDGSSLAEWVTEWPNLVVMQTLSKAFGLAGIRLGAAFTSPEIARLLNNLKAPYNISSPTSAIAKAALQPKNLAVMRSHIEKIIEQRDRILQEMPKIPGIGRFLGGKDSNFLLVEILDKPQEKGGRPSNKVATALYECLAEEKGVVVRFRGREFGCEGCLRITIGTAGEVDKLLYSTQRVLAEIFTSDEGVNGETHGKVTPKED